MKKKGFTLVELLAVIVILAIIALIAIPIIGNVIEKAKIGSLESSVNGLVESANMYYANNTIKGETITETTFDFEDGEQVSTQKLEYKGKVYNGKLILHANGEVAVCIDDEEHYAYKNKDRDEIVSGNGTCLYDGTTGDFSSNSPVEDLKQQIAAATATADKVLEGNTIYTSVGLVAGTMANYSNKTLNASTITESGDNAEITIPSSGYYDETSKISVPIQTIKNEVTSIKNNITSLVRSTLGRAQTFTYTFQNDARIIFCFAGATSSGRAGLTFNITGGTVLYDYFGDYQDGNNWTDMIIKVIDVTAGVTITATSNNYMSHYNILVLG